MERPRLIEGKLTISKTSGGEEYVSIEFVDEASRTFIAARVDVAAFGEAVMGLAYVPCKLELPMHPERFGKIREVMPLEVEVSSRDKEAAKPLILAATPQGWEPSLYLGSQNSFTERGGVTIARTSAFRWVDRQEQEGTQS